MNNNKETERAELHKTIWRIANDLRGSVDGWDFKSYVEQRDDRQEVDIGTLTADIARIVARQAVLREQIDAIVADLEGEAA